MSDDMIQFSDEERELMRTSVRRLLGDNWPVLKAIEMGREPAAVRNLWRELDSLAVSTLGRDPAMGGLREILLVFEELGRACAPAPLLGSLVANLIEAKHGLSGDGAPDLSGKTIAVGFAAFDGDRAAGRVSIGNGSVSGVLQFVEGAHEAEFFLLLADDPAGVAIVEAGASGLEIVDTAALSLPPLATLRLEGAPARFAAVPADILRDVVHVARLACGARALGAARRGFELVVEHAKTRKQFNQLIGQFQAVQHRLADNLTRVDATQLTLEAAAAAYDEGLETWRTFADLSLGYLNPQLRQLAIDMHQLMGAIGYAEEHELPRHFRQIHGNVARFGGVTRARAAIGRYLVGAA